MKKRLAILGIIALIALGSIVTINTVLIHKQTQISVDLVSERGNRKWGKGIELLQYMGSGNQTLWKTSFMVNEPEKVSTSFKYYHQEFAEISPDINAYIHFTNWSSFGINEVNNQPPYIKEVIKRAPNNQSYKETVTLIDYTDVFPFQLDLSSGIYEDFYKTLAIPTPPALQLDIGVTKDGDGKVTQLSSMENYDNEIMLTYEFPMVREAINNDRKELYFIINGENVPEANNCIYKTKLPKDYDSEAYGRSLTKSSKIEKGFYIPKDERATQIAVGPENKILLLTQKTGEYVLRVIEDTTMKVVDSLHLPTGDFEGELSDIAFVDEENMVVRSGNSLCLLGLSNNKLERKIYIKKVVKDLGTSPYTLYSYDGTKLTILDKEFDPRSKASHCIGIYTKEGLKYWASYGFNTDSSIREIDYDIQLNDKIITTQKIILH